MKKNGNWLIALDLTKADHSIIRYVKFLHDQLGGANLTFVHVSPEPRRARLVSSDQLDYDHVVNEELRLLVRASLRAHFDLTEGHIQTKVRTGEPLREILQLATLLDSDTIFLGKKKDSKGSGVISERLISAFESDVLLVPEGFEPRLGHVLLSTDFSEYATEALDRTMELKEGVDELKVTAFNTFHVPPGHSKTGKQYEEVEAIMRRHTAADMSAWLDEYNVNADTVLSHDRRLSPMQQLLHYISEHPVDLLILGSKGHTELSRLILGSNAWRLILGQQETPLLIVKKDDDPVGLSELVQYL
ncbi:MAG: universal stress protein [Bacteroidota bacterium]